MRQGGVGGSERADAQRGRGWWEADSCLKKQESEGGGKVVGSGFLLEEAGIRR
jgi:hypothetical protein